MPPPSLAQAPQLAHQLILGDLPKKTVRNPGCVVFCKPGHRLPDCASEDAHKKRIRIGRLRHERGYPPILATKNLNKSTAQNAIRAADPQIIRCRVFHAMPGALAGTLTYISIRLIGNLKS